MVFRSMLYFAVFCCSLYIFSSTPVLVSAMTAEQKAIIHQHFEEIGMECLKDNPVTGDDIVNLRSRKMPSGDNAPCFLSCIFKHIGLINDKGMIEKEGALELAKTVFNDAEELQQISDYIHSCSEVNSEAVTDGEKGCDRALMAYKCMTEKGSQFGFDV